MADKYAPLPPDTDWRSAFRVGDVKPSPPDGRDFPALAKHETPVTLPASFQLPERPIRNQGGKGACVAFSFARILERGFDNAGRVLDLSEEEMYARLRVPYDWLCQDTGSYPRDCAAASVSDGWLSEAQRPYNDRDLCTGPAANLAQYKGVEYRAARTWEDVKQILYQFGAGVTICLSVYDSFFSTGADGIMPAPSGKPAGGHCMVIEGWDDRFAWVANSWSTGFGLHGYLRVPLHYVDGSVPPEQGGIWTSDMWTVLVAQPEPIPPDPEPEPDPQPADGYQIARDQDLQLLRESVEWYTTNDPNPFAVDLCQWHIDVMQGFQPPTSAATRRLRPHQGGSS